MRRLNSLALRSLWSRKLRTLVTCFGVVLGVGIVLAFGITNATVESSLNTFFSQTAGDADLSVSSSSQGRSFRERALHQVRDFPGVSSAVGSLWKTGDLRLPDEDKTITLVGIDPAADPRVRSYRLDQGRLISLSDRTYTIMLVSAFAEDNGISLGDDVEVELPEGRVETFEVAGLLKSEGAARSNNGAIGFLRLDVAQALFDEGARLSQVDVVASPEIATQRDALDRLRDDLAAYLGADYTVAYPAAVGQAIVDSLAGLRSGLGIFSTIALFVGAMLIYNTFAMTVTERTTKIGMLRALGATRRQILRLVLVEAALMGFFGSLLGLGLGVVLSIPLVQIFAQALGGIPIERAGVPPASVVLAALVGILVTLLAALIPAWQAGRISPVEAMRARAQSRPGFFGRNGWKIGLFLLAFSLADTLLGVLSAPLTWLAALASVQNLALVRSGLSTVLALAGLLAMAPRLWAVLLRAVGPLPTGLVHRIECRTRNRVFEFLAEGGWIIGLMLVAQGLANLTPAPNLLPGAAGLMLLFTGATLVIPKLIQWLETATRHILSLVYGAVGGLGSRNLQRARGRTSLTVGVLMVGTTLIIAIGSIQSAFDDALKNWVANTIGGDLMVTCQRGQRLEFASQLMGVPGVEVVTPFELRNVQMTGALSQAGFSPEDLQLGFQAVDLTTYQQVAGFQFLEEAQLEEEMLARLAQGDALLVSGVLGAKYNLHRGDQVRLRTRRGERDFEVAGVINNYMWGGNSVVGIWTDGEQYLGTNRAGLFLVKLAPEADPESVHAALEARLAHYGHFEVSSAVEFRETITRDSRSLMALFNIVVYIAVIVAGLGVVNTMTMNMLERVREIGVLRAVGMTRRQLGCMVLAEAAAMGAIGGAAGLGIGSLLSRDVVAGMSQGSGMRFDYVFPATAVISALGTALIISQIATLYPMWRASRLQVVEAIQHE